jgi:hypothetical protein
LILSLVVIQNVPVTLAQRISKQIKTTNNKRKAADSNTSSDEFITSLYSNKTTPSGEQVFGLKKGDVKKPRYANASQFHKFSAPTADKNRTAIRPKPR